MSLSMTFQCKILTEVVLVSPGRILYIAVYKNMYMSYI
jgi:hypothetical protein